ncbi:MAG: peptidoglycan-binding domain-containing protein [Burkholderiaceae bacterium]
MLNSNPLAISALLGALILAGCGSTPRPLPASVGSAGNANDVINADLMRRTKALEQKEVELAEQQLKLQQRNKQLAAREAQFKEATRQSAAPHSQPQVMSASPAGASGDLLPPNARPGECYARVYSPPMYKVVPERVLKAAETSRVEIVPASYTKASEQVLVRPETKKIEVIPAQYETVTVRVMISPATKKLVPVPAVYAKQSERVMIKAGYTTWKKGTGPIQKVDESTGEIMCLVEVPPEYKTVTKTVQVSPPGVREVEVPAQYRTVKKQVLATPATTRETIIPAVYKTVAVSKLTEPSREVVTPVAAVYETVERREMIKAGALEWRSILCDTNMTRDRIKQIQQALVDAGYNPGPIDGSVRERTMAAVNAYQRAKGLPVDRYLNIETVKSLGVLPN